MAKREAGSESEANQTAIGAKRLKLKPSEAGFQKGRGINTFRCGDCIFFVNSACEKVEVRPDADDVCNEFEPSLTGHLFSHDPGVGKRTPVMRSNYPLLSFTTKGGPGSGYKSPHKGLKGVWGGSAPREGPERTEVSQSPSDMPTKGPSITKQRAAQLLDGYRDEEGYVRLDDAKKYLEILKKNPDMALNARELEMAIDLWDKEGGYIYSQSALGAKMDTLRGHKFLTKDLEEKLPPLYSQENIKDPMVWAKWFHPFSTWEWYATEYDPVEGIFFGWVNGDFPELGYFSRTELEELNVRGLPIERDLYFKPIALSKLQQEIYEEGKRQEAGDRSHQRDEEEWANRSWDDYDEAYCERKFFSAESRRKMAKKGTAMSDGSFPISDCEDVDNALRSLGRTNKSRSSVISHIRKRAKALGCKMTPALKEKDIAGLDLIITRVSEDKQTGEKRWFAQASGVERDLYDERMSLDLFKDFIKRAEAREEVPLPFSSEAWNGGLPYLGVAHYLDLGGTGIAGDTTQIYVDGSYFKARGTFADNPLGEASYSAIKKDIQDDVPHDQRARVSIAFIDWAHEHEGHGDFVRKSFEDRCEYCSQGLGEKIYKAGHLVHLALTRRPAYPQATIELEERSMTKSKRYQDAESIVGKELADELESKSVLSLVGKSEDGIDPNLVVVKAEEEELGEEEVAEEAPLGGAKSIDDAEAFLVQKKSEHALMDSWGVLHGVLTNIAGVEHSEAIGNELQQFQSCLDVMALKTLSSLQAKLEEGSNMSNEILVSRQPPPFLGEQPPEEGAVEEEPMKTGTVEEEAPAEEEEGFPFKSLGASPAPHALDKALFALRNAFDEAVSTPVDYDTRLRMIQPALNELGVVIQSKVQEIPAEGGISEDIINRAVEAAVAPLKAELAALQAKSGLAVESPPTEVPARRAITAAPMISRGAPESLVQTYEEPEGDNPTPSLRRLVRRSVGIRQ